MRVRRAWAATSVALLGLLGVAACDSAGGEAADPGASASPSGSASEPASDSASESPTDGPGASQPPAVTDPDLVAEPPGELQTPLLPADILITSEEPIDDETVRAVARLDGVADVARLTYGQVLIESRGYNLAAVDAATYRRFTRDVSATLQEQWERVAGGEVAALPELQRRLPTDEQGFLRLGQAEDSPVAHVGAYAPQVPTIDLVVNERWADALDMVEGNALVVSTFERAPQTLRAPIQRLVGAERSISMLDVASRLGLDPDAYQTAVLVGSFADAVGTFTYTVSGGRVHPDPAWVREYIRTETVPILGEVTCNKHLMPQLKAALGQIQEAGLADEIHRDEYAGCYYPRFIAGSTKLSNHAFGLALDLNVPGNLRGTVGEIDRTVVKIFKRWGFAWGGDWSYTDPMHFELERIVRPG